MGNFDREALVTPLPCERRHYFHTECVEDWMKETLNPACPICLVEISGEEIDNVTKEYRKKLA